MKNRFAILGLSLAFIALTACSSDEPAAPTPQKAEPHVESQKAPEVSNEKAQEEADAKRMKASESMDLSICDDIADAAAATLCRDAVYVKLAQEKKDASLCAKIASAEHKQTCEKAVSN